MMWFREKPGYIAHQVFEFCCNTIANAADRKRVLSASPLVTSAVDDYEAKAPAGLLYQIQQHTSTGTASKAEMENLYDKGLARAGAEGRYIYDEVMLMAVDHKCPYCEHRPVASMDHFLPKAKYVSFSVAPSNLFGACNECNHRKGAKAPSNAADLFFHPYFEDITTVEWLIASVVESNPCAVLFSALPPAAWSQTKKDRLAFQFAFFGLAQLYTDQAAVETNEIRHNLRLHFQNGGSAAVRRELELQWNSRRQHRLNSWRAAMYKALSESHWYCNGGFG